MTAIRSLLDFNKQIAENMRAHKNNAIENTYLHVKYTNQGKKLQQTVVLQYIISIQL